MDDDYSFKQQVAFLMSDAFNNQVSSLILRFENLFAQPPADLSSILREGPQAACSEALGPSLLDAAEANPLSIDASVQSLVAGLSTTKDVIHTDVIHNNIIHTDTDKEEGPYITTPFNDFVRRDIGDCLSYALHGSHQTAISRKNTMFSYALLAGSAVRNKLLGTGLINAFIDKGLELPGAITGVKNRREVMAIGVCLVLLVAGSVLVSEWRVYDVELLEKVVKALQLLKEKKQIKYPTGVDLLEVGSFFCALTQL